MRKTIVRGSFAWILKILGLIFVLALYQYVPYLSSLILIFFGVYYYRKIKRKKESAINSPNLVSRPIKKKTGPVVQYDFDEINMIMKRENRKGMFLKFDMRDLYMLSCQIKNNGSMWIDLWDSNERSDKYKFHVKTREWLDGDVAAEVDDDFEILLCKEWEDAWIKFGKPDLPKSERIEEITIPMPVKLRFRVNENWPDDFVMLEGDKTLEVSLTDQSCNCAKFKNNHEIFDTGDFRRCCQHIIDAMYATKRVYEDLPQIARIWMEYGVSIDGVHYQEDLYYAEIDRRLTIIFGKSMKNNWVSIITKDKPINMKVGEYTRYGYSISEKRWSYGEIPPYADEIIETIMRID